MFRINNSTDDVLVADLIYDYTPALGNAYTVTGPLWFSFGEFKILPRFEADVELTGFASLEELENNPAVVYPNPATTEIFVINYEGTIQIMDTQGRVVASENVSLNNNSLAIEALADGIYFAVLANGQTIRFVKQ
jgi:hypothetical protein